MILQRFALALPQLVRKQFLRDLGLVSIGQLSAQIISFAAMPVLTRIYAPDAIGLQGLFLSITGLFLTFSTLSLPLAIALPRKEEDARALLRLSIYISLISALILAGFLTLASTLPLRWLGAEDLYPYRYLIALSVGLGSISSALLQYLIRQRLYGDQAKISLVNSIALNCSKLGLGLIQPVAGSLLWANIAANILNLFQYSILWKKRFNGLFQRDNPKRLWAIFIEYRDFPLLRTPQITINAFSQFMPIWLLSAYIGPAAAGQYTIAIVLLGAPTTLLGKTMGDVLLPRLTASHHEGKSIRDMIVKSTIGCLALSIIPYTTIAIFGPEIFGFIYGQEWSQAGEYARWLSLWCMLQLVNRPAVVATSVLNIQGGLLIYELFSTATKIGALWFGFYFFSNDVTAIALFAISGIIAYIYLILWVIGQSGKPIKSRKAAE